MKLFHRAKARRKILYNENQLGLSQMKTIYPS